MNGQTGGKNEEKLHRVAVRSAGLPALGKREGVVPSRRPLQASLHQAESSMPQTSGARRSDQMRIR